MMMDDVAPSFGHGQWEKTITYKNEEVICNGDEANNR